MSKPRYSGPRSKAFWRRVNGLGDDVESAVLYALGCELQNLEERVMRRLKNAESMDVIRAAGSQGTDAP